MATVMVASRPHRGAVMSAAAAVVAGLLMAAMKTY